MAREPTSSQSTFVNTTWPTQSLYLGTDKGSRVKRINNNTVYTNPYFLSWGVTTQAANLDAAKWYKIVSYILPEGWPNRIDSKLGRCLRR